MRNALDIGTRDVFVGVANILEYAYRQFSYLAIYGREDRDIIEA